MKQQAPKKVNVKPEDLIKIDDEDEDGGISKATAEATAADAMASALEKAHLNLSVQVDIAASQSKSEHNMLLARSANPLKPVDATKPADGAGPKHKLSLDDYKRRRGLL